MLAPIIYIVHLITYVSVMRDHVHVHIHVHIDFKQYTYVHVYSTTTHAHTSYMYLVRTLLLCTSVAVSIGINRYSGISVQLPGYTSMVVEAVTHYCTRPFIKHMNQA